MSANKGERAVLQGTVARITYQDPAGRYTVARLEIDGARSVTVVGEIYPVGEGEEIKVSGLWRMHPRYGLQFQAEAWEKLEPATLEGIERYLGSGLIKGIGPVYARRLVGAFGLDTLRILTEEPHRIHGIPGIGKIRARRILHEWEEQKGMRDAMIFLQGHRVTPSLALKIYRAFGSGTVARVKDNPYCLQREVRGVGFVLADRIAKSMGVSGDFPLRVQAGILHVLKGSSDDGHCFVPLDLLKQKTALLLSVEEPAIESAVRTLAREQEIVLEDSRDGASRVYARDLYRAELRVAAAVRRLLSTPSCLGDKRLNAVTLQPFSPSNLSLDEEQREAVLKALREKILVITGGPGTGKTTLLIFLLSLLRSFEISFALAAPTGRAAKRMGEMTGEEAKTIHRLLEYNPHEQRFQRGEDSPLETEVVIIDEASMVDLALMDHLLRAVDRSSHLILLGDVDQLPSVGPGSVLRDLIDSGAVPVVILRRIFRQAGESLIVLNAHRILRGEAPLLGDEEKKRDFIFVRRESEEEILETIKTLAKKGFGDQETGSRENSRPLDRSAPKTFHDIQVLTPMHRGLLGTVHLNRELQSLLNAEGEAMEQGGTTFRVGDKVMQLRNNYDKGTFNGDVGRIVRLDNAEEGGVEIDFYGRRVWYALDEIDEIGLAYATSIHKSQGSEYRAVVIPLHTSHYLLLHRSILYTAVTRAKEMVVLVGSRRALTIAIRNVRVTKRFTGLKDRLTEG